MRREPASLPTIVRTACSGLLTRAARCCGQELRHAVTRRRVSQQLPVRSPWSPDHGLARLGQETEPNVRAGVAWQTMTMTRAPLSRDGSELPGVAMCGPLRGLLIGALFVSGALRAADWNRHVKTEIWEDHSLSSSVVTPHTKWGKPAPGGPLRALFIVNDGHGGASYTEPGTRLREVVELMQRFDIDGDAVMVSPKGELYQGKHGEERARKLLANPYDVFVFGNVRFEVFCPELQYRILERVVRDGAGLVCCGPAPAKIFAARRRLAELDPMLCEGLPLAALCRLAGFKQAGADDVATAVKLFVTYGLGKGRGVHVTYPASAIGPRLSFSFRALTEYDYWMLVLGRAVLWASGRRPEVSVGSSAWPIDRRDIESTPVTVTLATERDQQSATVQATVRRGDGWSAILPESKVTLKAGAPQTLRFALPRGLRADVYFLDCLVRTPQSIVGSGSAAISITSESGIADVSTNAKSFERGQRVRVRTTTRGAIVADDVLRVQLRDAFDRILARESQPLTPGKGTYDTQIAIGNWATIHLRAEAALIRDGVELEKRSTHFYVPKRRRGQFNFVQWGGRSSVLEYYAWKQLAQAGWKVLLGSGSAMPAFDVTHIPYTTRLLEKHDKNGHMEPVCWNDEPAVTKFVDGIVSKQTKMRTWGTFVYSLGDEGTTKGCCVHPACLDAYRAYLEEQHGTIESLNAAWGTTYAGFSDVALLDPKDTMEGAAAGQGLHSRWYDRQAFARYNLARLANRFVNAFEAFDPHAITGFEGTGGFGDDFDTILENMTFWSPYPSIGDDILRSVADRSHIRANWMGYHKQADPLINFSWRMVMKEMDSIWWWRYDGCGSWRGYISPIIDFWPATEQVCAEMAPVREGLGDLLLHSTVTHSGIAVYYSLPSALCGKLGINASYPGPKAVHGNWIRAIYDLGLDMRYVTSGTIAAGALEDGGFTTLLLPMAQAMPTKDAEAVRAFVSNGGTVLADLRPAIMDGHCKPLGHGSLDDVFGITRTSDAKALKAEGPIRATLVETPVDLDVTGMRTDPAVRTASARALAMAGEVPILIENTFGKGQAILLNLELPDVQRARADGQAPVYRFLRALFTRARVTPAIQIASPDGGALPHFETRVWQNGEMTVIGLWREMAIRFYGEDGAASTTEGKPVSIRLSVAGHVYDLRNHAYLGHTDRFVSRVAIGRANFFAVLPYRLSPLTVKLSATTAAPGDMLRADIALRTPAVSTAAHAAFVEVIAPDGHAPQWGSRPVLLTKGRALIDIPVAYNASPGSWKIRVRELFTGEETTAAWKVE